MAIIDGRGWTCPHVSPENGPCAFCRSRIGDGICRNCMGPIDDHTDVGTAQIKCAGRKKQAA